jgi:sortase (surface protein transpeptidase)
VAASVVTAPQIASRWRAYWDPESEILILTLTSAILAGLGLALVLMGALPATPRTLASESLASESTVADTAVPGPAAAGPAAAAAAAAAAATPPKAVGKKVRPLPHSVPRTLDIPAIGVHTPLMSLGLESDGTVEVPPLKGNAPAGWYRNLSTPGEAGPAVILGHVDSAKDGPAVFYRLRELRPGARLTVDRADGTRVKFMVRSVARYPKNKFPTAAVYGPRPGAELRLVTCGGSFDALRGRYRDNIVVYAVLTGSTKAKTKARPVTPRSGRLFAGDDR